MGLRIDRRAPGAPYQLETLTAAGALRREGFSILSATSASAYTMAGAEFQGVRKQVFAASTEALTLILDSGVHFSQTDSTTVDVRKATFNDWGECIELYSRSATEWIVLVNTGAVAFAST